MRILHRAVHHEQAIEREVNPYKLWYVNNGLYLVGHDHREDDLRTFAVERVQSAKLTNRRFEIPPDFNFEEFKQTAFNMIWGEPQEVKIRFSPSQAPYIRERTWHPSQEIEPEFESWQPPFEPNHLIRGPLDADTGGTKWCGAGRRGTARCAPTRCTSHPR